MRELAEAMSRMHPVRRLVNVIQERRGDSSARTQVPNRRMRADGPEDEIVKLGNDGTLERTNGNNLLVRHEQNTAGKDIGSHGISLQPHRNSSRGAVTTYGWSQVRYPSRNATSFLNLSFSRYTSDVTASPLRK